MHHKISDLYIMHGYSIEFILIYMAINIDEQAPSQASIAVEGSVNRVAEPRAVPI